MTPEIERINFLLHRDGPEMTKAWVQSTLNIYQMAIASPSSHASHSDYKPLFFRSIREFEDWLEKLDPQSA